MSIICSPMPGGYSVTRCKRMQQVAAPGGWDIPGLRATPMTKTDNGIYLVGSRIIGTPVGVRVTYHDKFHPAGIVLNYCPFCGGQLYDFAVDESSQPREI